MVSGKIQKIDLQKGYGFVDFGAPEQAYFRTSSIPKHLESLKVGDTVTCTVTRGERGFIATIHEKENQAEKLPVNPYVFFPSATLALLAVLGGGLFFTSEIPALWCYLAGINASAFLLMGYDKSIAGSSALRMPEKVIFFTALLGGSPGVLTGMKMFRHKTRKGSFQLVMIAILIAQIVLLKTWSA